MSKIPVDPELRDELLVQNGKIIMRGTDNSIWCYAILPVLLEEESVGKGDPRIAGRHIVGVEAILPRNPTQYQKTVYYGFSYAIRARLFPRCYYTQSPPGLEGGIEKEKTDPTMIEYEGRQEHPSLKPEPVGRRYPVPQSSGEDVENVPPPASGLAEEERRSDLKKTDKDTENFSRFKQVVTQMAGVYLGGHPSPDGMSPDRSILRRARNCVAGKTDADFSHYHLFLALTYRKTLCKLADRYVVLVATAPGGVLCADWDCAAAESLGDKYEWYNRLWKKIYTMELFPPPSPAGEQGSRWRKPVKYLAAALIFARNDEAEVDEKLDWLFAVKTKALDGICRGLLTREPSIANLRQEVGLTLGRFLRDPFPERAPSSDSSTETVRPDNLKNGNGWQPETVNVAQDAMAAAEALATINGIKVPPQA